MTDIQKYARLKINYLLVAFLTALFLFFIREIVIDYYYTKIDFEIYNKVSKDRLSRLIMRNVFLIEMNTYKAASLIGDKYDRVIFAHNISFYFDTIDKVITVLDKGGKFVDYKPDDFGNDSGIIETISYAYDMDGYEKNVFNNIKKNIRELRLLANEITGATNGNDREELKKLYEDFSLNCSNARKNIELLFSKISSDKELLKVKKEKVKTIGYLLLTFVFVSVAFSIFIAFYHVGSALKRFFKEHEKIVKEMKDAYAEIKQIFNIALPLCVIGIDYKIKMVSKSFCSEFEQDMEEVVGKYCFEVLKGEKCHTNKCPLSLFLQGNSSDTVEHSVTCIKGAKEYIYQISAHKLVDSGGEIVGVIETATNITKRKEEEEKIRNTLEVLETILMSIPIGIMIVDKNMIVRFVNPAAADMMGIENTSDIIGNHCYKRICPSDKGKCPIIALKQKIYNDEKILYGKNGEEIPIYKTAVFIKLQGEELFLEAFIDIREMKKLQSTLKRFMQIVEQSPIIVVMADINGNIRYVNPTFTKVTGYASYEVIGQNPGILKSGYHSRAFYENLWNTILSGKEWFGEFYNKKKDGTFYWESAVIFPIIDENGKVDNFVAIKEDITEKKKILEDLEKAKNEAEKSNLIKTEFLANMSHEIRTPMNAIVGFAELLQQTPLDDQQRNFVEIINVSGTSLLELLNDILDIAKIEAGEIDMEETAFVLSELIDETIRLVSHRIREKKLELYYYIDSNVPYKVQGDPYRLKQVILNLLTNAVKFTDKGEIVLKCEADKDFHKGDMCKIIFSVKDTGIGIPKEKQSMVFSAFMQVDASTTRRYGGTGLGLAISKSLVEKMRGDIFLFSEEGKGSEFRFYILLRIIGEKKPVCRFDGSAYVDLENVKFKRYLAGFLQQYGISLSDNIYASDMVFAGFRFKDNIREFVANLKENNSECKVVGIFSDILPGSDILRKTGLDGAILNPVIKGDIILLLKRMGIFQECSDFEKKDCGVEANTEEYKVLVVEDNFINVKLVKLLLEKVGAEVDVAVNGKEAVEKARSGAYDIIFMELQMPVMGGYEAAGRIREFNPDIPIVALSTFVMEEDIEKVFKAGMNDFLSIPINSEKLKEVLKKWAGKQL